MWSPRNTFQFYLYSLRMEERYRASFFCYWSLCEKGKNRARLPYFSSYQDSIRKACYRDSYLTFCLILKYSSDAYCVINLLILQLVQERIQTWNYYSCCFSTMLHDKISSEKKALIQSKSERIVMHY